MDLKDVSSLRFGAFLVAQMVKNPPTMLETWVRSLSWEDPLEEGMATQYSCLQNPHGQRSLAGYSPQSFKELEEKPRGSPVIAI